MVYILTYFKKLQMYFKNLEVLFTKFKKSVCIILKLGSNYLNLEIKS